MNIRGHYDFVLHNSPTFSQSGGTIWHFFFTLRFAAIHIGTLHLDGGRNGPYAPCIRYFSEPVINSSLH